MRKEDFCVDSDTMNALLMLKEDIIKAVTNIIKSENATLENNINKIYGIRLEFIEREQTRSFKHHEEHFIEFKAVHKRIDGLESRQSKDEGMEVGSDRAINEGYSKKSIFIAGIGISLGLIGTIIGFIL